jgi:hypothetical protein
MNAHVSPPSSLSLFPSLSLSPLSLSLSLSTYIYISIRLYLTCCVPSFNSVIILTWYARRAVVPPPHPPILMMLVGASGPRSKKTKTTKKHAVWFNIDIRGRGGKLQPKGAQGKYQVKYIRWWQDFYIVFLRSHYDGKEAA